MTEITVGELRLELCRKSVKHVRIVVAPPDGRVRVSAPQHVSEQAVRAAVAARIPWIKRQQARFAARPRAVEPQFISGEIHWLWGSAHPLQVEMTTAAARVELTASGAICLQVRPGTGREQCQRLLQDWYRRQLQLRITEELEPWQQALGVRVNDWGIKRMKTRWGSCNIIAKRIWLNLALAKLPPACCQYVLVHELAHLIERYHNARFWGILDQHLPSWRESRAQLAQLDALH